MSLPLSPVFPGNDQERASFGLRSMRRVTPAIIGILALAIVVGSVLYAATRSGLHFDQPPEAS